MRVRAEPVIGQQRHNVQIIFKVTDLDGHHNLRILIGYTTPLPEIGKTELACTVGHRRIEQQPQSKKEIALADAIFADDHDVARHRDVEFRKVPEVLDFE
jgi:hypothetical protein